MNRVTIRTFRHAALLITTVVLPACGGAMKAYPSSPGSPMGDPASYALSASGAEMAAEETGVQAEFNTEQYAEVSDNPFLDSSSNPLSTFSIDVDTASYSNVRRFLTDGSLPPRGAVRIEELVNYFRYDYEQPVGDVPFSVSTEVAACPWKPGHQLMRIGLQGKALPPGAMPPRNLVFLFDVSGSMNDPRKLPLLKGAFRMLVDQLGAQDTVAVVVYAGASGMVLPPTSGANKARILEALQSLEAGGSTNGGEGIELAYRTARAQFRKGGVNRVILATDGDFNVGVTSHDDLVQLIERERQSGVFLSVLGFGTGNVKDSTMEMLADKGNGNYAYIDTLAEARKVLVEQAGATLVTIAKDVKIQVEFNPRLVQSYRLIGYENRMLRAEDFHDDRKDAGEIGAGHSVTALYELVPHGVSSPAGNVDPLRYQGTAPSAPASTDELLTIKLRYKAPAAQDSQLLSSVVRTTDVKPELTGEFAFASSVAAFGMILRRSEHKGDASYALVRQLAARGVGQDGQGYRREFLGLVDKAAGLDGGGSVEVAR